MPPMRCAQSSVRARSKRTQQFRRASLALSTPLRKQRTPHPSKSTKYFHPLQILPLFQQISPGRSPSPHPTAASPSHSVDTRPRIPDPVVHLQKPPHKPVPPRLLPPMLLIARPPRSVSRKPPTKPSRLPNPPLPLYMIPHRLPP